VETEQLIDEHSHKYLLHSFKSGLDSRFSNSEIGQFLVL